MPFQPGENVGPYRIIEQLGQGGMATVFKAYHPALDRNVAIKAMHPAFMQDPQFQARFEREARVVASLDHPNIVPIYDFAQQAGQPYLVMKFIEGQTLKAVLDSRSLTRAEVLHVVKSVGAALSYAHSRGILHRDIKPSNVLLTPASQVYLADFGLARIAEAGQSTLSGDQLLGTPHYISPEQARGERDLDQGTDIYSLGIVLYQLTVGRVPFNADTPFSIIHDHIYTPLPMPRKSHPEMSESLEQVLLKALAKDRADRFAGVDDLVRAFEAAFEGKPTGLPAQATAVGRGVAAVPGGIGGAPPEASAGAAGAGPAAAAPAPGRRTTRPAPGATPEVLRTAASVPALRGIGSGDVYTSSADRGNRRRDCDRAVHADGADQPRPRPHVHEHRDPDLRPSVRGILDLVRSRFRCRRSPGIRGPGVPGTRRPDAADRRPAVAQRIPSEPLSGSAVPFEGRRRPVPPKSRGSHGPAAARRHRRRLRTHRDEPRLER